MGHFTDGLYFVYLQFKMLREKPQTLQEAVPICIEEQNLRKLSRTRTGRDYGRQNISHPRVDEPMEVDM